ncbi:Rha family transcriptional regulator [Pseudomonas piscis]|uniref:Rha family transcriptional regulator n=1 Tax=Pseudomonas piscis TaxID=2614538 RepID=A0ABY9NL39_9PSED|nr:Rha family transcriptional regulator [Pseudomonas piscis]WMN19246.1 Rha family transcriptional regulator [Pseudomonas piscis]
MTITPFTGGDAVTMSSVEIAELTGKLHKNVLADIRSMLAELEIDSADFSAQYQDSTGRLLPCFNLDRELTETLITGYSVPLRHKVIRRLHDLEEQAARPMTQAELIAASANQLVAIERRQAAHQVALERVEDRTTKLEQVRYLDSVPSGFETITTIRDRINRRHGLPAWVVNAVMREVSCAPLPYAFVRSRHADEGGQPFAIWPKPAVTQRFDRFVSECTYETAERATHPEIPQGRFKIHPRQQP